MTSQPGQQRIIIQILLNISRLKGNQAMKLGQLMELNDSFSSKVMQKTRGGNQFQTTFSFLKILYIRQKKVVCSLVSLYFHSPHISIQKNKVYKTLIIYPEIYSILIFQKTVWKQILHRILCISFQQNSFPCYVLSTDQISLAGYLHFLRHWIKCVL